MGAVTKQEEMPFRNCELRPLGEVVKPTRPRIKPSERPELPFIGMEHVEAHTMKLLGTVPAGTMKSSAVHFMPGDVLYGRLRPYLNKVYRPDFEGLCSAEFIVFPKIEGLNSKYLQYFLNSSDFVSFASQLNTGDRPRVDFEQLATYPFPVRPLDQQERIVAEIEKQFSRLDEGIENLKRVQANLKRYKAAILKAAVEGRLVETEAELARREGRDYETGQQLLQRILAERRRKWEEAELAKMKAKGKMPKNDKWKQKYKEPAAPDTRNLPELPEGWVWATFDSAAERVTVGHVGSMRNEYVDEGIPFLRSQNVRENHFEPAGLKFISQDFHRKLEKSTLKPGDIVVVRSGNVGVSCVIPEHVTEANCSDLVIIKNPQAVLPKYGAYYMNSVVESVVAAGKVGVALTHFNTRSVAELPLPIPPLAEQHRIVTEVERRLSILRETEAQVKANLQRAERLRQAILAKAFSGQLVPSDGVEDTDGQEPETDATMAFAT